MTNQPIQVNTNFFTVQGIDYTSTYGACSTTDNFNVLYDKVVKFSGDLKYSCNYLKSSGLTYAALSSLQVFNNLYKLMSDVNDFYIGIYGNSNFNYIKDWLKVQIKDTKSALETSINTDQNIPRRLLLFVGYNKMGANGDEQYYVSSASLQFTDYMCGLHLFSLSRGCGGGRGAADAGTSSFCAHFIFKPRPTFSF